MCFPVHFFFPGGREIRNELRKRWERKVRKADEWSIFVRNIRESPVNNFTCRNLTASFPRVRIPRTAWLISPMTPLFHITITSSIVTWRDLCRRRWIARSFVRIREHRGFYCETRSRLWSFTCPSGIRIIHARESFSECIGVRKYGAR